MINDNIRRIHFTNKPFELDTSEERIKKYRKYSMLREGWKPGGLWYGTSESGEQDQWLQFCIENDWTDRYGCMYSLHLYDDINLLRIKNHAELLEFTRNYYAEESTFAQMGIYRYGMIDWISVMENYDGIEIHPYIYSARMENDTFWYYPWDVASGCIWNVKKITLELVEHA